MMPVLPRTVDSYGPLNKTKRQAATRFRAVTQQWRQLSLASLSTDGRMGLLTEHGLYCSNGEWPVLSLVAHLCYQAA